MLYKLKIKGLILMVPIITLLLNSCSSFNGTSESSDLKPTLNVQEDQYEQNSEKQIKIGFALGTLAEERWVNEKKYFESEAEKYGAKVIFQDANMDENIQNSQIENLISQKIDVLVIVAVNAKTAATSVATAKKLDIPVLAYSRMITDADLDAFIGFDAIAMGVTLAKAAIQKVPEGNYMIINGAPIDNNARLQQVGYYSILQPLIDKGKIKVVSEQWCENWSQERAMSAAENGLTQNKNKIDAILVSNDGMAGGVVQALKAQKLEGRVFVSGTDGDLNALQRIAEGSQTVTLLFPQKEFAEEGARVAISLANRLVPADATGKTFNGLKDIPTVFAKILLLNKENLKENIIKNNLQKIEEVYKNVPKDLWPK